MARKSQNQTDDNILNKGFFEDLIDGTGFVVADEGCLMSSRKKVTTPLYAINCIYGGGLPLSVLGRISGHPGSGKSTFSYQTMANYQKEYPDGVPVIYDMEASMDNSRLKILGVDTSKVLRLPATSLENAFQSMFMILEKLSKKYEENKDITTFQIYDTISVGGTDAQHEEINKGGNAFNAGPMMQANRIIKQNLVNLPPYIEKLPVFIGFLEQVFTQVNSYGGASVSEGKNFGLDHACHAHIFFEKPKDEYDDRNFLIGTLSNVILKKSKLSPKIVGIPCYIDVTKGGRIDEVESFLRYIASGTIGLVKSGSWWSLDGTIKDMSAKYPSIESDISIPELTKSMRRQDMVEMLTENKDFLNLLQIAFIDLIDSVYPGQKDTNNDYRKQLISECSYFKNYQMENE